MKTWAIPVTWEVYGTVYVDANTLDEAVIIARDDDGQIPIPEVDYVDGSWRISEDDKEEIRYLYNDGQEDCVI